MLTEERDELSKSVADQLIRQQQVNDEILTAEAEEAELMKKLERIKGAA